MIGTYNTERNIKLILTEYDKLSSESSESLDGKMVFLDEKSNKPLRLNIVDNTFCGYNSKVFNSEYGQTIYVTRKKLLETFNNGKSEMHYLNENNVDDSIIEFLYTEKNDDAKNILEKMFSKL